MAGIRISFNTFIIDEVSWIYKHEPHVTEIFFYFFFINNTSLAAWKISRITLHQSYAITYTILSISHIVNHNYLVRVLSSFDTYFFGIKECGYLTTFIKVFWVIICVYTCQFDWFYIPVTSWVIIKSLGMSRKVGNPRV